MRGRVPRARDGPNDGPVHRIHGPRQGSGQLTGPRDPRPPVGTVQDGDGQGPTVPDDEGNGRPVVLGVEFGPGAPSATVPDGRRHGPPPPVARRVGAPVPGTVPTVGGEEAPARPPRPHPDGRAGELRPLRKGLVVGPPRVERDPPTARTEGPVTEGGVEGRVGVRDADDESPIGVVTHLGVVAQVSEAPTALAAPGVETLHRRNPLGPDPPPSVGIRDHTVLVNHRTRVYNTYKLCGPPPRLKVRNPGPLPVKMSCLECVRSIGLGR